MTIAISLLGGFRIVDDDGTTIKSLGRKSQSLIALLALSEDLTVTREKAAGLVWSDRRDTQARASLRQELSQLRRRIGKDALVSNKLSIWFNAESVSIDVLELRAALASAAPADIEAAANLYTGPLLEGHQSKSAAFEDWIDAERRSIETAAIDAMSAVARNLMASGDYEKARGWAERATRLDPLREASHCLSIEASMAMDDRAAAGAAYKRLEQILAEELGTAPSDTARRLGEWANGDSAAPPSPGARTTATPQSVLGALFKGQAAVAVLPFKCLSAADDDRFFADGLTEDVVNSLAVWRWFPVIGRHTTAHFRNSGKPLTSILPDTGARYVIDGSVRRSRQHMRITAELCDATDGQMIWSRRFDAETGDLFAIQDEISDEIARRVEPEISRAEIQRIDRKRPADLSVWEMLHKARVTKFRNGHTYGSRDDNQTAMEMYRNALAADPHSSDAAAGIATCHWHNAINGWSPDPARSGERAMRRAGEAVRLDGNNYTAIGTVSIIQTFAEHDATNAQDTARRSLEMNPSDVTNRHYLVCSLEFGGKFTEAIEHCQYMMELDPKAPALSVLYSDFSTCLLLSGNPKKAVEKSRKSMEADPGYSRGRQRMIAALVAAGELAEAEREHAILMEAMPGFGLDYVRRTYPFSDQSHLDTFLGYFAEIGVT